MVTPGSAGGTPRGIAPFIKRADEIQAHNALMAYYCESRPGWNDADMTRHSVVNSPVSISPASTAPAPEFTASLTTHHPT